MLPDMPVLSESRHMLRGPGHGRGIGTMDKDIVVTRTTVGLTLAGLFASFLLAAGVIVCAIRGFACFVFG